MVHFVKDGTRYYKLVSNKNEEITFTDLSFSLRAGDILTSFNYIELENISNILLDRQLQLVITCSERNTTPKAAVIGFRV